MDEIDIIASELDILKTMSYNIFASGFLLKFNL